MVEPRDTQTSHDGESLSDDELLDDFVPTRVSVDLCNALAVERGLRSNDVRVRTPTGSYIAT
jgi:hypothetical protein